jgi:hypothetical protein
MKNEFLTAAEAAKLLGCNPQSLRVQARTEPRLLGFPVVVVGTRLLIPKKPFLEHLGGTEHE